MVERIAKPPGFTSSAHRCMNIALSATCSTTSIASTTSNCSRKRQAPPLSRSGNRLALPMHRMESRQLNQVLGRIGTHHCCVEFGQRLTQHARAASDVETRRPRRAPTCVGSRPYCRTPHRECRRLSMGCTCATSRSCLAGPTMLSLPRQIFRPPRRRLWDSLTDSPRLSGRCSYVDPSVTYGRLNMVFSMEHLGYVKKLRDKAYHRNRLVAGAMATV